jgi:hypothetical protein
MMETHISWVLLTGEYAYKIKKPVNLGFVDFTSLAMRRYYCEEELRLNRRLAPGLYLDVVEIRGDVRAPRIGGTGRLLEYAVKMREFPQAGLASRALAEGTFGAADIDCLAGLVAEFHARTPAATPDRLGAPDTILSAARQNFDQLRTRVKPEPDTKKLRSLREWTEREFAAMRETFAARKREGFVRECHGDLHLGNIAMIEGKPVPFDCIEFNDELRWIDVMSEVAFAVMDLEDRQRGDLAWRFLNRYLEATGDYPGVRLLRFYFVYRALVRAKVHLMRAQQPRLPRAAKSRLLRAFRGYVKLAERFAIPGGASLFITHGLSGCGKTTMTQPLIELLGAVRLRSDVERKRLHGLAPLAESGSGVNDGIYTPAANAATYRHLGALARGVLAAGYSVVVDATFLKRTEREIFRAIAEQADVRFVILNFLAPLEVLRARIAERKARADDVSEADLAVLQHQVAARESLTPAEMTAAFAVDGTRTVSREMWSPLIERLRILQRASRGAGHRSDPAAPLFPADVEETATPGAPRPLWP